MPDGPWTKYQQPAQEKGPWSKYGGESQGEDAAKPAEKPGFIQRFGEATGIPTSIDQLRALNAPSPVDTVMPGMGLVSNIVSGAVQHAIDANKSGLQETREAVDNIKAGQPVLPNIGKMYYGAVHGTAAAIPPLEPAVNFGEDVGTGNTKGAAGGAAGMFTSALAAHGASKIPALAAAEHNPNAIYHRYLDPVTQVPEAMPQMTPRVEKALTSKMEINHPDIANRMRSGSTTLGDLDKSRIVSGKASQAAYSSIGKPTEMVEGYQNAANSLRDTVYPKVEQLNNLNPDSLRDVKKLEGKIIRMGPEPEFNTTKPSRAGVSTYLLQKGLTRPLTRASVGMQTRFADPALGSPILQGPQRLMLRLPPPIKKEEEQ